MNAKKKNPSKIVEFFTTYSHEILLDSDNSNLNLRAWYVLPYVAEPEKDAEFAVYFTQRWADVLRISLHNMLSVVMKTSPTPKLILLDRWYSSEAQEALRSQVRVAITKIEELDKTTVKQQERLKTLQTSIRNLVLYVYNQNYKRAPLKPSESQENGDDSDDVSQVLSGRAAGVRML